MAVVSLSLDESILEAAKARALALGFKSFSAYVQSVVRADLLDEGPLQLQEAPTEYGTVKPAPPSAINKPVKYSKPRGKKPRFHVRAAEADSSAS